MDRLEIRNVSKVYGELRALRDVSLAVDRGVVGLLGPNGAGKSTLMRILATLSRPTEGEVRWEGRPLTDDPDRVRRVLGYLPQSFGIYPKLSAREFLRYLAAAKGLDADDRIDRLLSLVDLREAADRKLETFSGGMRQRVGIAQALLNDPELLIVDEPTVGLDPEERIRFRSLLSELGRDRIVLLSTHIVSDVEAAAGRIAVLHRGRLVTEASPGELLATVEGRTWRLVIEPERLPDIRERHPVTSTVHRPDGAHVRVVAREAPDTGAEPVPPGLEDAYLWIMIRGTDGLERRGGSRDVPARGGAFDEGRTPGEGAT